MSVLSVSDIWIGNDVAEGIEKPYYSLINDGTFFYICSLGITTSKYGRIVKLDSNLDFVSSWSGDSTHENPKYLCENGSYLYVSAKGRFGTTDPVWIARINKSDMTVVDFTSLDSYRYKTTCCMCYSDGYIYIAYIHSSGHKRVAKINTTTWVTDSEVVLSEDSDTAKRLLVDGDYLYLTHGGAGRITKINKNTMTELSSMIYTGTMSFARDSFLYGDYIYTVYDGGVGSYLSNVAKINKSTFSIVLTWNGSGTQYTGSVVYCSGNNLIVAGGISQLMWVAVLNPNTLTTQDTWSYSTEYYLIDPLCAYLSSDSLYIGAYGTTITADNRMVVLEFPMAIAPAATDARVTSIRHTYKSNPPTYKMKLGFGNLSTLPDYQDNLDKLKVKMRKDVITEAVSILQAASSKDLISRPSINKPTTLYNPLFDKSRQTE